MGRRLERSQVREAFYGHAWHEIPTSTFADHRQALFFLTPKAWAYYVPTYMLAALDSYRDADMALGEIASSLMPTRDPEIERIGKARLAALTERQRNVLLTFIEWAATEHPEDIDDDDRAMIVNAIRHANSASGR